jgi:hypothetical protein
MERTDIGMDGNGVEIMTCCLGLKLSFDTVRMITF